MNEESDEEDNDDWEDEDDEMESTAGTDHSWETDSSPPSSMTSNADKPDVEMTSDFKMEFSNDAEIQRERELADRLISRLKADFDNENTEDISETDQAQGLNLFKQILENLYILNFKNINNNFNIFHSRLPAGFRFKTPFDRHRSKSHSRPPRWLLTGSKSLKKKMKPFAIRTRN